MTTDDSCKLAVNLGLLRFPPPGEYFKGKHGNTKKYLIDARGAGINVDLRELIVKQMSMKLGDVPPFDVIGGIAKSGTMWGAWLAWNQRVPFANILLDGPRTSGLQREVEGDVTGRRVLLVDNWTRTGESISKSVSVITRAGGNAVGSLVIVRHPGVDPPLPLVAAWELEDLLSTSRELGLLEADAEM